MHWEMTHRGDSDARTIADRHYNRQKIGAKLFAPPGRAFVLLTARNDALWITSFPYAEYVLHAWAGAWINSCFRNESEILSSELIVHAVAATRWRYGQPPALGLITFIDTKKVRKKRDWGRCYRKAGFTPARCPIHEAKQDDCAACHSMTKAGLFALQMSPLLMPEPETPSVFRQGVDVSNLSDRGSRA